MFQSFVIASLLFPVVIGPACPDGMSLISIGSPCFILRDINDGLFTEPEAFSFCMDNYAAGLPIPRNMYELDLITNWAIKEGLPADGKEG